jgi:O-antigen ligase
VYFAILALETRTLWVRVVAAAASVGCILVVGLTVSRTPLAAAALCIVLAFRRVLKRGFVPALSLVSMAWLAYGFGLLDQSAASYAQRGAEETGRLLVWPLAMQRFLASPLIGVGADHVRTYIPSVDAVLVPHNGFIFIALAAGAVPLLFFTAYWAWLFMISFGRDARLHEDATFHTSLLLYSFLITMGLNQVFMSPWTMGTLAAVAAGPVAVKARRVVAESSGVGAPRRYGGRALVSGSHA